MTEKYEYCSTVPKTFSRIVAVLAELNCAWLLLKSSAIVMGFKLCSQWRNQGPKGRTNTVKTRE